MTQTILITGSSSGLGRATAEHFHSQGWNVVATMRNPQDETELSQFDNVLVTRLDVQDPASIESAVAAGIARFGRIDALMNNAGYGAYGPLEATPGLLSAPTRSTSPRRRPSQSSPTQPAPMGQLLRPHVH